jgi:hypothetical protein
VYLVIDPNIVRFLSVCNELLIGLSPHKYQTLSMCFVTIAFGLMIKVLMREGMSWENVLKFKHNLASVEKSVPTFSS